MNLIKNIILFAFLLLPTMAFSQINLRPGYIITNLNDTIYGSIDFRTAERNALQCTFRELVSNETTTYHPSEIYAYRFTDDGKFYVSRTVTINDEKKTYFLEYVVQGIISLYYLPENIARFFFENEEGTMIEVSKEDKYIVTEEGRSGIHRDNRYIGILKYLFSESDKVQKKIPRITFGRNELVKITKDYHYDVCETGEDCIEFEAKKDYKFIQFNYTLTAGFKHNTWHLAFLDKYWHIGDMNSATPSVGVEVDLTIPRLTRVMSAKVSAEGSMYKGERVLPSDNNSYMQFKASAFVIENRLGLCYSPFHGKLRPYIEAGYAHTFLTGLEVTRTQERYQNENKIVTNIKDYTNTTPTFYMGYYLGGGLKYKIGKHTVSLSGYYRKVSGSEEYNISSLNIIAGFTF